MSVGVSSASRRRRNVRCPDCGSDREVSLEQAIRIGKGIHSAKCSLCKHPPTIRVTEEHRRYWLERAGVPVEQLAGATGSIRYVRENGMPDALQPIAASSAFLPR